MTLYRLVLFGHVTAVTLLFAALAIEWLSLHRLAKSKSFEQAREWSDTWRLLLPVGLPGMLVVLSSGIYLAVTVGAWELGWVRVAVPTLVLVAIAGAIVGPRRNRLRSVLAEGFGALPADLQDQLRHPLFIASWRVRAALLVALVFAMTARPDPALPTMGAFFALGIVASLPAYARWYS
jgi:hypothetical protein